MRPPLFHPLGITMLAGSLIPAGTVRFLPGAGGLSTMAPWILFCGALGFTSLVAALLWSQDEGAPPPDGRFSETDLSEASVKKRLRGEALQHPATVLPLAVAVDLACYLALLPSSPAAGLVATAALVIAVVAAAGSFLWHYAFRHQHRYAARSQWVIARLEETRTRAELAELKRLREKLEEGFPSLNFPKGARALRGLEEEFSKLRLVLEARVEATPLSIISLALAGETYHRGLSVLADALELMRAIHGPDRKRLEAEIEELEREAGSYREDAGQRVLTLIQEDTLASHRQRLAMLDQLHLRVDQLLHLAGRCEASLHRTRIELAGIRAGGSESSIDSAVEALQETVRRAKEVQEELHRLGY